MGSPLGATADTLAAVLRNRDIRRLELAWTLGIAADWALLVVGLLVAYDAGGAVLVGLVPLLRMAPATAVNLLLDPGRFARPERVLVGVDVVRALAAGTVALGAAGGSPVLVFAALAVEAAATALVRPTMMAILPAVARTPDELVSVNVTNALGAALGTFVGPLAASVATARSGSASAAALAAAVLVVAGVLNLRVRIADSVRLPHAERRRGIPIRSGIGELLRRWPAFVTSGSIWAQVFVRGALTTYLAILSLEVLGFGDAGIGLLGAAIGLGGLAGAVVALALGARRGLGSVHVLSLVLWGAPLAVIGIVTTPAVAIAALAVVGIGNALIDVAGFTLLQRGIPSRSRMAVFSVLEVGAGIAMSLGGIAGSLAVEWLGIEQALVLTGLILPIAAVACWPAVRRLDREATAFDERAAVLQRVPLFRPLPLAALERLAAGMRDVRYAAGERLMTEGEWGDEYVVIASGSAVVTSGGRHLARLGPGDGCGEIGLLRAMPRIATVEAVEPIVGWAIECPVFLAVVTGQEESRAVADALIEERLDGRSAQPTTGGAGDTGRD